MRAGGRESEAEVHGVPGDTAYRPCCHRRDTAPPSSGYAPALSHSRSTVAVLGTGAGETWPVHIPGVESCTVCVCVVVVVVEGGGGG